MNTINETRDGYKIFAGPGPSKDVLFDACKYAYDDRRQMEINFGVAIGYTMAPSDSSCAYIPMQLRKIRIASIEYDDNSGHNFNISGYCEAIIVLGENKYVPCKFRASYDTEGRKGTMFIES